jgi:hypothetical protein
MGLRKAIFRYVKQMTRVYLIVLRFLYTYKHIRLDPYAELTRVYTVLEQIVNSDLTNRFT